MSQTRKPHRKQPSAPTREGEQTPVAESGGWRTQLKRALKGTGYDDARAQLQPEKGGAD